MCAVCLYTFYHLCLTSAPCLRYVQCSGSSATLAEQVLVSLAEVAADSSDHRGDELGQPAELPAEEGVGVLGFRGHGLQVVDGSPGHAHRVDDDI